MKQLILAKISDLCSDFLYYRQGWVSDWKDEFEHKFSITMFKDVIIRDDIFNAKKHLENNFK